jgi:hypothetical protein
VNRAGRPPSSTRSHQICAAASPPELDPAAMQIRRLAIAVGDWRPCLELAAIDGLTSAWLLWSGQAECATGQAALPGGAGDVGGDDVGGMPVQTATGTVVSHGGPGISVGGSFLYVPQRDPGVQRCGNECVP